MRDLRDLRDIVILFVFVACGGVAIAQAVAPQEGLADWQMGLSRAPLSAVARPDAVRDEMSDPGEQPLLPRAFPGSPPVVPHAVSDYLPITREENLCIECHGAENTEPEDGMTAIPPSHYIDLRQAPETSRDTVAGARWVCVSCHLGHTDAVPLVGNRFGTVKARPVPARGVRGVR